MTHHPATPIAATPIAAARIVAARIALPRRRLKNHSIGPALLAIARAIGQAFEMAYVTPYQAGRREPRAASDAGFQGRDPKW